MPQSRQDTLKRGHPAARFGVHALACPAVTARLLKTLFCSLLLCSPQIQIPALAGPPAEPGNYQLHPELEMTLFAREPDVVSPVALTWDEGGRMYVVEMRDYPYGFGPERKPGGTIRLLEDTQKAGKAG